MLKSMVWIPALVSLKLISKDTIHNKSTLIHVMTWYQSADKPLTEPMMIQFTDAYIYHQT